MQLCNVIKMGGVDLMSICYKIKESVIQAIALGRKFEGGKSGHRSALKRTSVRVNDPPQQCERCEQKRFSWKRLEGPDPKLDGPVPR